MAKGDDKKVRNEINTEQKAVNDRYSSLYGDLEEKRKTYSDQSNEERQYLVNQFRSSADVTGGLDPTVISNIRGLYGWKDGSNPDSVSSSGGSGGGSSDSGSSSGTVPTPVNPYQKPEDTFGRLADTGGIEIDNIRNLRAGLEGYAQNGGWDPDVIGGVNTDIANLRKIGSDGGFDDARRASIMDGINRMKTYGQTGGYDPDQVAAIRGDINTLRSLWGTGGYDPEGLANSRGRISRLDELGRTGGMSDEDIARFRGTGYQEFADTGGYTPEQIAELRNRATSLIPAQYAQTMADANRLRNSSGSNTGFLAAAARLQRGSAQNLAAANRDAEIDLQNQIREGRRWGIEGLQETENELQSLLVPNKVNAASAAAQYGNQLEGNVAEGRRGILKDTASLNTTLEGDIAKNRIGATEAGTQLETDFQSAINNAMINASKGAGDLATNMQNAIVQSKQKAEQIILENETEAQKLRQQGMIAGAQGLTQIAAQKQAEAARAQAAANSARASDQANDRWWANFIANNERYIGSAQQEGRMDSLRGLTSIYGMDPTLGRDNLALNASSAWADDNRGLLGLDVQMGQRQGNSILDWARFGSGFIPGGKPDNKGGQTGTMDILRDYGGADPAPGQNINDFTWRDLGGSIDTGPGSPIWNTPPPPPPSPKESNEDMWPW